MEILFSKDCKSIWKFLVKLSVNLYDLSILLLSFYSRESKIHVHEKTRYIAALFIIAKK